MSGSTGHKSCSLVSIVDRLTYIQKSDIVTGVFAFICLVVFVLKLDAYQGQSYMTRLVRKILLDSVLYFLIMAVFHITMLIFTIMGM